MYVCIHVSWGGDGGLQQLQKVPESVFLLFGIQSVFLELGKCRNKKHNCNFVYCSQSKHVVVYYGERERGKIICLNASRKES